MRRRGPNEDLGLRDQREACLTHSPMSLVGSWLLDEQALVTLRCGRSARGYNREWY
jgi:hypothetical protein